MNISIEKITKHKDERGYLAEFLKASDLKMMNSKFGHLFIVTFDTPRALRGNHYHKKQHEYYGVALGKIRVLLKDLKTNEKKTVILNSDGKKFTMLRIGPNIAHVCYNLTPKAIMISYFSLPYSVQKADTTKYLLIKSK